VTGTTSSSVSLSWTAPPGTVTGYDVYENGSGTALASSAVTFSGATATVTGLSASTGYTFTVAAVNAAGTGAQSSSVSVTTSEAVPGAPSGLSVTGTTSSSVSLSWTAPSGPVSGYYVYLGGTELPSGGVTVTVTGTTATVSGLSASTAYELSVAAFNGAGTGTQSSQVAATTGVPAAPAGLSVTATTSSSVSLSWTAPPGTVTGYDVYENGSGTALASSAVTFSGATATVTGLSASTGYTFTVAAVNAAGTGAQSSSVSATTANGVPAAPTGLTVTSFSVGTLDKTTVHLSWTAPAGTVTGYDVYVGDAFGTPSISISGTTATVKATPNLGPDLTFAVAAYNTAGTGPESNTVTVNIDDGDVVRASAAAGTPAQASAPPGVPAGLAAAATTSGSTSLSWNGPSGTVTGYYVYENGTEIDTVTGTATKAAIAGLAPATAYIFTVAAYNSAGTGPQSAAASIITTAAASSKAAKATALAGGSGDPSGYAGNGGPATAALLQSPDGLAVDAAGNVYVSDSGNNQVREIAAATGAQHGQAMTAGDIYAVAGNGTTTVTGAACPAFVSTNGDQGPAVCAVLSDPQQVAVDQAGDVYIADSGDSAIREVPAANGAQWSQSMTSGDIYDVAGLDGNPAGDTTGDGASAATTFMAFPYGISTDPYGDLYVLQQGSTGGSILPQLQEITATAALSIPPGTSQTSSLYPLNQAEYSGGGITITQPDSSQVTFDAELPGGGCPTDYSQEDGYCLSGQFPGATLASSSSGWVYTPTPGGDSFTYPLGGGQLTAETDTAGNKLSINYNSPAPGTGSCPSAAASCQTIIAATGRTLVIGSNASGLVTSATDPLGRTWTYAYNSSDQLTSATDPMGNIASYTYGQGSNTNAALANDLLTITGPNAQPGGPDAGDSTVNVYDGYGRVTTQTDPMGWKTIFNYCVNAAAGDCLNPATGTGYVTITDPDGNTTTDGYQAGDLVSETQHTAATLVAENDYYPAAAAGVPWGGTLLDTTTTDGEGDVTSYAYNTYGQQISVTAPSPAGGTGTTTSSYTAQGQDDCDGTVLASSTATCAQDTGPLPVAPGGVITPASSAPPDGLTWTLYDTDGNELYTTTGVYEPGASTASYSRTTYQLFNGNSVTLNGTSISCAAKSPVSSLPCATINADGVVTQLGYDPAGDLTSSATPDGNGSQLAATTYSYDTDGEQTSKTSPDGNLAGANAGNYTTTIAYNADGKQTALTMAGGSGATATPRSTLYSYDSDGNQVKVEDARGYTAVTQYNADDQATMVTTPDGDSTLTCYDGDGNTVQTVLPVGVAVNDLTPASCPTSYPAGYSDRLASDATVTIYNAEGQVTSKTAPAPAGQSGYETTSYTYNADGQPTQISSPPTTNGGTSQVTVDTYGSAGQLASQTTGYGTATAATTSYCYDSEGGTTSVVAPDGNTSGTAPCETSYPWTISATENPTQASYQTIYGYDSAGEPVSTTTPATGAAPGGALITATYDAAGNVLTRTDPDGVITTYTYTPAGQPAAESYSGSAAAPVSYTYDANGAVIAMTDGTGTSTYQYDSFGDLTSAQNGNKQTVGYEFDADGDVTSITYPLPSAATWAKNPYITYGYDNADQLTSVTDFNSNTITITNSADGLPAAQQLGTSGDTITTTYSSTDSASAVTLAGTAGTLQSFSYADAPAGNILTETDTPSSVMSPASYGYDAQGRVTSDAPGSQTADDYALDPSGNLTTLPNGAAGTYNNAGELTAAGLSGSATSYTYSPDGERLTAAQGGTTTDTATWNGAQELTAFDDSAAQMGGATYNGTGLRTSATFTPAGGSAVTQAYVWRGDSLLLDSSNAYIYGHGGTPVEQVNLSTGAVTYLVTDSLGSVRGTVSSSGALTGTTSYDAWGNPQTPAGLAAVTPFGFAGGYTDPDGLIYLIDRYYDPATGQFISVDPDLSQTQQPYEYTGGDPVNATDPTGTSVPSGYGYSGPSLGDPDSFQESTETEESAGQFEQAINAIYELKESDPIAFNATTIAVVQREVLFNDKDSPDGFSTALQTTVYVNGKGNGGFIRTLQRMGLRVRPGDGDEHAETVAEQEADYGFIEDPGLGEGMLWRVRNWFQNRPPCPQCENPATTAANTPVDQGVEMTAEDQGFTTETMGPGGISMVLQEEISPIQSQGLNPAPIVTQWYKYNLLLPADLDGGGSGGGGGGGVGCEDDEC
jgi:RHS repeat-associated protein